MSTSKFKAGILNLKGTVRWVLKDADGNIVKEELFNKLGIELDYPKIIVFNEFT